VWYTLRAFPLPPEVIGIYNEPPPEACSDIIRAQQVAALGAVPLLERATALRDWIANRLEAILDLG
jgi:hypothetical protein